MTSPQEVEIADRKSRESDAKLKQSESYLASALSGLEAKKSQLVQKQREAEGYVETTRAEHQKAIGEVALRRRSSQNFREN